MTREDRVALHAELVSWAARQAAEEARFAKLVRRAEQAQLWMDHGCVSFVEYLERALGIEPRTALDKLRVAHRLNELPMIEARLEAGTYSYSHVRALTRVVVPETEADWIATTEGKTVREVQQMLVGRGRGARPDDPIDPDRLRVRVSFDVSLATKARLARRRRELVAERGHDFEDDDAFVNALCDASDGDAKLPTQVFLCAHEECAWDITGGEKAPLEPEEAEMRLCDAELVVGARTIKGISPRRRAKLLARHGNACAVPGCRAKRHIDLHHIVHREDGGGDEDWNLVPLCSGHHRLHHRRRLHITGRAPDAVMFRWIAEFDELPPKPVEDHSIRNRAVVEVDECDEGFLLVADAIAQFVLA